MISNKRRPRGRELIRSAQQSGKIVYDLGQDSISGLGVALMMALTGLVIALSPNYLDLPTASITSDLVISLAISLWFWGVIGFFFELSELKKFISGLNEKGWENILISTLFLAPAGAFYWGVHVLEFPIWITLPLKLLSIALGIIGVLFVAAALDAFFIKPRLKALTQAKPKGLGKENQRPAERRSALGSLATATTWMLANAANLLVIIEQLVPRG